MIESRTLALFWARRLEFATFALLFRLLEAFLFAPFIALGGETLVGQPVVDSTKLVAFVLSPRGFLVLFTVATIAIGLRLVEQAGLSVIALGALNGVVVPVRAALRVVLGKMPRLDRKSTRLNSSHVSTSYAVFFLI